MTAAAVELLHRVAIRARPAGSDAEREAREFCRAELMACGFAVYERAFEYSAFPGLWGTPVVGGALTCVGAWTALRAGNGALASGEMVVTLAALAGIGAAGWWLARFGTTDVPILRRNGSNLEARRGVAGGEPRVWLVAHIDSKRQPVSLLVRAGAVLLLLASWTAVLAAWVLLGSASRGLVVEWGAWLAAAASLPLALSVVVDSGPGAGGRGTGALDNATGVATVLRAAQLADPDVGLGVLVTSAEELGLAGARAWLRQGRPGTQPRRLGVALNCDGVDDSGPIVCTIARDAGVSCSSLERIVALAGERVGGPVRTRRSMPGVLFDSVAFAQAGWSAVTISKGTAASLRRVHTPADNAERVSGSGVEQVASLIAGLAGAIIAGSCDRDDSGGTQR